MRKTLGVAGLGINWGIIWGLLFAYLVTVINIFRPQDFNGGEGPVSAGVTGFKAGLVSGLIFGVLVAFAENRKPIPGLNVLRLAVWGVLASAVWPLVTRLSTDMMLEHCLLGGSYAAASVALARAYGLRQSRPSLWFTVAGRSVRDPLRAACAPR